MNPWSVIEGIFGLPQKKVTDGSRLCRTIGSPPLVVHVLVALTTDRDSAMAAGHRLIDIYTRSPFYVNMFTSAGFPTVVGSPDALVDSLVISGNEDTLAAPLSEFLQSGLDELMVTVLPIVDSADEQARLLHSIERL